MNYKHGKTDTREYKIWEGIRKRCKNKNVLFYANYGGRGIQVEWNNFEEFFRDMGLAPSLDHSIDRIDNNGNYSKENCRWATAFEQMNNRRNNILITFDNKTKTAAQWAEITGIDRGTIVSRIKKYGWSTERALSTPVHRKPDIIK